MGNARSLERFLDGTVDVLFGVALFVFLWRLFWTAVAIFTFGMLDFIQDWPAWMRLFVGVPLIAMPVLIVAYLFAGDEERPGWLVLYDLRKHAYVRRTLGLVRKVGGVVAAAAFVKLMWLTGQPGPGSLTWWEAFGELMRRF